MMSSNNYKPLVRVGLRIGFALAGPTLIAGVAALVSGCQQQPTVTVAPSDSAVEYTVQTSSVYPPQVLLASFNPEMAASLTEGNNADTELLSYGSQQSFRLTNETSEDMVYFYASSSYDEYWSDDLLGSSVLGAGDSQRVTVYGDSCLFDFRAEFSDGSATEKYGIDVCETSSYTIY